MKKIYLASDHAGFELKEALMPYLQERGYEIEDLGPHTFEPGDDYPDYFFPLARKVAEDKDTFGIGIGLSGEGEAMAANRTLGARAAEFYGGNSEVVRLSREHNDANILVLGARFLTQQEAKDAVILFLTTNFSGEERHARRIAELG